MFHEISGPSKIWVNRILVSSQHNSLKRYFAAWKGSLCRVILLGGGGGGGWGGVCPEGDTNDTPCRKYGCSLKAGGSDGIA